MSSEPLLISAEQLAEKLNISARTVWRLLSRGHIVPPVKFGGTTRWELAKIEQWIEAGCPCQKVSK